MMQKKGKRNAVRMKFLATFTKDLGLTDRDIAEKAGCARSTIQNMWSIDDATLARVYRIVENCRYSIQLSLIPRGPLKQGAAFLKIEKLAVVTDGDVKPARLAFLRLAMKDTGLTTRAIASRLDLSENTLFYYSREDNTSMKFICRFAEEFGYDLNVRITERKVNSDSAKNAVETADERSMNSCAKNYTSRIGMHGGHRDIAWAKIVDE